jgi:hypothetical protein
VPYTILGQTAFEFTRVLKEYLEHGKSDFRYVTFPHGVYRVTRSVSIVTNRTI